MIYNLFCMLIPDPFQTRTEALWNVNVCPFFLLIEPCRAYFNILAYCVIQFIEVQGIQIKVEDFVTPLFPDKSNYVAKSLINDTIINHDERSIMFVLRLHSVSLNELWWRYGLADNPFFVLPLLRFFHKILSPLFFALLCFGTPCFFIVSLSIKKLLECPYK